MSQMQELQQTSSSVVRRGQGLTSPLHQKGRWPLTGSLGAAARSPCRPASTSHRASCLARGHALQTQRRACEITGRMRCNQTAGSITPSQYECRGPVIHVTECYMEYTPPPSSKTEFTLDAQDLKTYASTQACIKEIGRCRLQNIDDAARADTYTNQRLKRVRTHFVDTSMVT